MRTIATCALALTLAVSAHAADVDWKLYSSVTVAEGAAICFYEARSTRNTLEGYVRVWTKCLFQKDLDSVDINSDLGRSITERAAQKVLDVYVPPIALVEDINFDQAMGIIRYEETANVSDFNPAARFFYEFNCPERKVRRLSTYIRSNGKEGSDDKTSDWSHVGPEGSGATLVKILCRG